MVPVLPLVGQELAGYRLRAVLGRGGMSVVFEAENPRLSNTVALKVLAPELAMDDLFRARFLHESRTAAALNHPNVIPIYDMGPADDLLYIAMRYVAGADLRAVLKAQERLTLDQAILLLGQAGRALDAAHRRGLVHRDVKPANFLIERGVDEDPDHVYLADFGITKHELSRSGLTATGQFVGTVAYIAPEQIQGKHVDGRADIYSLGCVLYESLTGRVPFTKDLDAAVIWAHVEESPTPPSAVRPELPPHIDDVISRAMAKDPDDRYSTCREFMDAARAAAGSVSQNHVALSQDTAPRTVLASFDGGAAPAADEALRSGPPEATPGHAASRALEGEPSLPPSVPFPSRPVTPTALSPSPPADPTALSPSPPADPAALSPSPPADPTAPSPAMPASPSAPSPAVPASIGPTSEPADLPATTATSARTDFVPPAGTTPPPSDGAPSGGGPGAGGRRPRWLLFGVPLVLAAVVAAVVVVVVTGGSSTKKSGQALGASLAAVPDNRVSGNGTVRVSLRGDVATVTVDTQGLLNGSPHLMHIHGGGEGTCPSASAAREHNGHLSISTGNGIKYYGPTQVSLTDWGNTSGASPNNVDFSRYPATGSIRYTRKITLAPIVANLIRQKNAVIVVHGIDYNDNHRYDFSALGVSDLDKTFPGESTAPALCGPLRPTSASTAGASASAGTVYSASLQPETVAPNTPVAERRLLLFCHIS